MPRHRSRPHVALHLRLVFIGLLAFAQFSCSVGSLVPERQSMPAARASLRPEYRVFYDTLLEYGEWILIEPYGFVFRPNVNLDTFRPFGQGFWVPTDVYGWVWVSSEPFGWATYHYGDWAYDPYQGWVWIPGLDWSPAQVAWQATDTYVGWSPLMHHGAPTSSIPGGLYSYVPASQITSTDLASHVVSAEKVEPSVISDSKPVRNFERRDGIQFNRGPDFNWVSRVAGPLKLAKIDDLVPPGKMPRVAEEPPVTGNEGPMVEKPVPLTEDLINTKRAGERAATSARSIAAQGGDAPSRIGMVRPVGVPGVPGERTFSEPSSSGSRKLPAKHRDAKRDSTR